jgi:serine/threonine-protein kinase
MRRFGSTAVQGSEEWIADRSYFLQAGRQSLTLRNPRIVSVLDVIEERANVWVAAEFVQDETLDAVLQREKLSAEQTSYMLRLMALALDYAHASGVPHGDLKPSNIFVGEKRTIRLTDFAISPRARRSPQGAMDPAWVHPYLSPEHFIAPASIGARSDQYSLAAIAYRMYTGKAPFAAPGGNPSPAILRGQVATPSTVNRNLPAGIDIPILRALSRDPAQRYSSCIEFVEQLEASLVPTAPLPVAAGGSSPKLMYAGLGSLVVALGIAAALMLSGKSASKEVKKLDQTATTQISVVTPPPVAPSPKTAALQKTPPAISTKPSPIPRTQAVPPAQRNPPTETVAASERPVAPQPVQSAPNIPISSQNIKKIANAVQPALTGVSVRVQSAPPPTREVVLPPPVDAHPGYSLKVFSRDEAKHPIENGLSFAFRDPELGEMGVGDLKAHVVLNGPPPGKGPLTIEWKVDGTTMDGHLVNPNTISEFGNEPIPGAYRVVLRQGANTVAEYTFRITR